MLADPGCRADQGARPIALYGHRVAGRLQLVERGPLGAVRPPPRRRVAPRARAHRPLCVCRMIEQKKPLKAQLASELSAAASDEEKASVRAEFEAREVRECALKPTCTAVRPHPRFPARSASSSTRSTSRRASCRWPSRVRLPPPSRARSTYSHTPSLLPQSTIIFYRSERRKEKRRRSR